MKVLMLIIASSLATFTGLFILLHCLAIYVTWGFEWSRQYMEFGSWHALGRLSFITVAFIFSGFASFAAIEMRSDK